MSALVHIQCDLCGFVSESGAGTPKLSRALLVGWSAGYIHKPYPGKRADYCDRCTERSRGPLSGAVTP